MSDPVSAIRPLTKTAALAELEPWVRGGGRHYVCFCEASLYASATRRPDVAAALAKADLVLADGIGVYWLAALKRRRVPERVPGPSFLLAACESGVARGFRHFFLGGAEGVAERLAQRLQAQFPGLVVVGCHSPPFRPLSEAEEAATKTLIATAKPDILWVGLGSPKQELWMAQHVGQIDVPVMLGVGAAFDFHSGARAWAPAWVRRAGLEWAFRTFTGGWRVFRRNLGCVTILAWCLVKAGIARGTGRGAG